MTVRSLVNPVSSIVRSITIMPMLGCLFVETLTPVAYKDKQNEAKKSMEPIATFSTCLELLKPL